MDSHTARTVGVLLSPFMAAVVLGNLSQDWVAYGLYVLGVLMLVGFAVLRFMRWAWRS